MSQSGYEAYLRFLQAKRSRIQAIVRATGNEYDIAEVEQEAWAMAFTVSEKRNVPIDFDDAGFQGHVLAFLYNELVRYRETVVRRAIKLDKQINGEDISLDDHPALRALAADRSIDPAEQLEIREELQMEQPDPSPCESLAGAYYHLLRKLGSMRDMAQFLLISLSYCYRRCKKARITVEWQLSLPSEGLETKSADAPRAWRAFRIEPKKQLELPLEQEQLRW